MFSEVRVAVERLALCLCLQRRIGAAHALLHLRRLVALAQRQGGSEAKREARNVASALARPLKELDDALAADHLSPGTISDALLRLSLVAFRLWQLAKLHGMPDPETGLTRCAPANCRGEPSDRRLCSPKPA